MNSLTYRNNLKDIVLDGALEFFHGEVVYRPMLNLKSKPPYQAGLGALVGFAAEKVFKYGASKVLQGEQRTAHNIQLVHFAAPIVKATAESAYWVAQGILFPQKAVGYILATVCKSAVEWSCGKILGTETARQYVIIPFTRIAHPIAQRLGIQSIAGGTVSFVKESLGECAFIVAGVALGVFTPAFMGFYLGSQIAIIFIATVLERPDHALITYAALLYIRSIN